MQRLRGRRRLAAGGGACSQRAARLDMTDQCLLLRGVADPKLAAQSAAAGARDQPEKEGEHGARQHAQETEATLLLLLLGLRARVL